MSFRASFTLYLKALLEQEEPDAEVAASIGTNEAEARGTFHIVPQVSAAYYYYMWAGFCSTCFVRLLCHLCNYCCGPHPNPLSQFYTDDSLSPLCARSIMAGHPSAAARHNG